MSAMNNLDLMIQQRVNGPEEYNDLKEQISAHLNGDMAWEELTPEAREVMQNWEVEEMELENNEITDEEINAWEMFYLK